MTYMIGGETTEDLHQCFAKEAREDGAEKIYGPSRHEGVTVSVAEYGDKSVLYETAPAVDGGWWESCARCMPLRESPIGIEEIMEGSAGVFLDTLGSEHGGVDLFSDEVRDAGRELIAAREP